MSSIFEDEDQRILKVPIEIWNVIVNYYFWIDPAQHPYSVNASFRVLKSVFALTSKTFNQLVLKLTKNMTYSNEPLARGSVTTFCCNNGYTSLLKYAFEHNMAMEYPTWFMAAQHGFLDSLKVLEDHGLTKEGKKHALDEATRFNQMNIIQYLLNKGIKPNESTIKNAAGSGNLELVKFIEKYTPLNQNCVFATALKGSIEILQYLRDRGFEWDKSACKTALDRGHRDYVIYSLRHGAPIGNLMDAIVNQNDVDMLNELQGRTCPWVGGLMENAASRGQLQILKFMIENGEEVSQHQRQFDLGYGAYFSVQRGHLECLKYLLDLGATRDDLVNVAEHIPILKCLREKGFQWNMHTIFIAAQRHNLEILRYLYENGCPWDKNSIIDDTLSASGGDQSKIIEVLKYMHEQGCSWSARTCNLAVITGLSEVLKFLHENNCPWDERAVLSALDDQTYDFEILKYLSDNGCPWDKDQIMEIVVKNGDLKTLQFFFEKGASWTNDTCHQMIQQGKLDMLKFAHENGAPWNPYTVSTVFEYDHVSFPCLEYAVENGYPWDPETTLTAAQNSNNKEIVEFFQKKCKDIGYDASNTMTKISTDPNKKLTGNISAYFYEGRRTTVQKSTPANVAKKVATTEAPKKAETKSNCSIS